MVNAPPPVLLTVNGLTYSHYAGQTPIVENICFSLTAGTLMCLAGMNGSGKTTLLCLLAGILNPDAGSVTLACSGLSSHTQAAHTALRTHSALVLHDGDMQIIGGTVGEDMLLSTRLWVATQHNEAGKPVTGQAAEDAALCVARKYLQRFALLELFDTPVQHLSYGQKRKLCLACALVGKPQLLLLDEPQSGLDYPATCELLEMIAHCRAQGTIVVVSTHNLHPFADTARHLLFLHPTLPYLFGEPHVLAPQCTAYGIQPFIPA